MDHAAASGFLQGRVSQYTAEEEKGLGDLQGLVGAALAVPKEAVQPVFEALGKRHLSMLAEQQKLQLQPALISVVVQCIGGCLARDIGLVFLCQLLRMLSLLLEAPQLCCCIVHLLQLP